MNNTDLENIIAEHFKLQEALLAIEDFKSPDEASVYRDRAMRSLWALMEYFKKTSLHKETVLVLLRLIEALNDLERGARSPILNTKKTLNGRAPLTEVHTRRAIVRAVVKHMINMEVCRSESEAIRLIASKTGIKLGSLRSDLIKAVHDSNLDILDPSAITIDSDTDIDGMFDLLKGLFTPKP
jgi:hypothetical protein